MYTTSEEEYTFKVSLVFWKFYEIGEYFEVPELRKFLEQEGAYKLYNRYHCNIKHPITGEKCHQPLKWISSQSHKYAPVCFKIGKSERFSCSKNPNIVGKIRLEGKDYIVQDKDEVEFKVGVGKSFIFLLKTL